MSRIIIGAIALYGIAFLLMACKSSGLKTVTVTGANAGGTVELNQGDILKMILTGNPTTGFTWEAKPFDKAIIHQKGEMVYKPDRDEPGYAGSPGKFTWRFDAVGRGQTDLSLVYHRVWEKETPPAQTYQLTIKVK